MSISKPSDSSSSGEKPVVYTMVRQTTRAKGEFIEFSEFVEFIEL